MIGLEFDLVFQFVFRHSPRHRDNLGDYRGAGDGDGGMPGPGARAFDRSPDGFTNGLDVSNILLDDRVWRERFDRVAFNAVARAAFAEFQ